MRPCVRPSVIHVVVLCFRDISSTRDGFSPNFCHRCILGHRLPDYVFGSKGQSSRSHHRGGGAQHSTLPSSATFSSCETVIINVTQAFASSAVKKAFHSVCFTVFLLNKLTIVSASFVFLLYNWYVEDKYNMLSTSLDYIATPLAMHASWNHF